MSSENATGTDAASARSRYVLLAAAAIIAYAVVSAIVNTVAGLVGQVGMDSDPNYVGALAIGNLRQLVIAQVPLAIGVYLSFRFIAPILPGLSIGKVMLRALIATAIGVLLAAIVTAFVSTMSAFTSSIFSDLTRGFDARAFVGILTEAVRGAVTGAVAQFPLVLLLAFAVWYWLSRRAGAPSV